MINIKTITDKNLWFFLDLLKEDGIAFHEKSEFYENFIMAIIKELNTRCKILDLWTSTTTRVVDS